MAAVSSVGVLLGPIGVASLAAFAASWGWFRLRPSARPPAGTPWPAIVACLAMPFALPSGWVYPRIFVSVWAITMAAKIWMLARGGARDPAMLERPGRFLLWLIAPPESTWPRDAAARHTVSGRGWRRLARALLKLPAVAALLAIEARVPELHDDAFIESFWALWLCWLGVSAITDLVSSLGMIAGIDLEETFDKPPLARSPREFWGRRWNLFVHRFVMRFVFFPLGGRRHPMRATLVVFLASGVMHEYFIVACLGRMSSYPGWMTAFFTIHGAGVIAQMALQRRRRGRWRLPRSIAVVLHIGWLTLTGPLFFTPLGEIFGAR